MALLDEEDNPPMEKPPKGILSMGETLPTVGLGHNMGEQMAPDEDGHSDAETVHAGSIMDAIKANDVEALRDALAPFVRECVRNYEKGNKGE